MTRAAKVGLLLAVFACAAPVAWADWIVTRDGGKLETRGGWQVKGKLVVFSLPNGTLSSLRSDKVDFEASRRMTDQATKEAAEGPAAGADKQREAVARPKKPSVRVLTDKDFKRSAPEPAPVAADAKDAKDGKEKDNAKEAARDTAPAPLGSLQVVSWDRIVPANPAATPGVQLAGKVRNAGSDQLTELVVTASLYDDSGALIARVPAVIAASQLAAGETATFTVDAPSVAGFAAAKFDVQGRGFKARPRTPAKGTPGEPASPPPPG